MTRRPPSALRRIGAVTLVAALAACSGDDKPVAAPSAAPASRVAQPSARPKPTASVKPTATPSSQPKPVPMSAEGAFLKATSGDQPVNADPESGCFDVYPGLLDVSCATVDLDGGTVLWIAGSEDAGDGQRRKVILVHTFDKASGGYLLRFLARDPSGGWTGFRLGPARLTGNGVDALIVQTTLAGDGASYDILTWRSGGPLVLRAHRAPARQLRVVAREGRLDDYQIAENPRFFVYRRLTWDGARIVIANFGPVPAKDVPPPA